MSKEIVLIVHDIRSCHNVGSILRTADGLGVDKVCLTGYTPYPLEENDTRLPHESHKISKQIQKTALGAEKTVHWEHSSQNIESILQELKESGYELCALEQSASSTKINNYKTKNNIAILIGREVEGIEQSLLDICDEVIEIPMFGKKESLNVVQATAILLYHLRFLPE